MKTITVQIGNSDDKLSQKDWAQYFRWVDMEIRARANQVHFCGTSPTDAEWQNACWVFELDEFIHGEVTKRLLKNCARHFQQDSIAWTEGDTEFIG